MFQRGLVAAALCAALLAPAIASARRPPALEGVPRYDHVFVIVEENKDYAQIVDGVFAPAIAGYAKTYGVAARFYGETHPSEGNYVALLGGDTGGIHDDDAFYCKPGLKDRNCPFSATAGYTDHTLRTPHLGDQLTAAGLAWKGYFESLPAPGSLAYTAPDPKFDDGTAPTPVYASKHSGFVNFATTQADPDRARRLVGFDQLWADIAAEALPNFALIVPNQCNEMHGLHGGGVPADCDIANTGPLIRRGDAMARRLVEALQATRVWRSKGNVAIVITFDEGSGGSTESCCGWRPDHGGGHIPTLVITNHGPRGVRDETPYNHFSLLRTLEDAFGLSEHLGHAGDTAGGVVAMTPLFAAH